MPTPPETNGETSTDLLDDPADGDGQGRGEANGNPKRSPRRRTRPSAGEKSKGRKLTIRDSVFARLELQAIKKGLTVSAVVDELLDRELPRHRIVTD
jgi:hypothetical protein